METQSIAKKLVEYCSKGDFEGAQKELFAEDVVSIEPRATPMFEKETKGLPAIFEKNHKFEDMTEKIHSIHVSDPLVASEAFSVVMDMDITMKKEGRMQMKELCVYKVKDGKIVSEEFFM